jgi:hypothetical protein
MSSNSRNNLRRRFLMRFLEEIYQAYLNEKKIKCNNLTQDDDDGSYERFLDKLNKSCPLKKESEII